MLECVRQHFRAAIARERERLCEPADQGAPVLGVPGMSPAISIPRDAEGARAANFPDNSLLDGPHERKDMPWFDTVTTIPKEEYVSSFANHRTVASPYWTFTRITRPEGEEYSGKEIFLPHVRRGLPFTTTFSDMCDTLCEPIRWAKHGGCWYNDDWHHWNSHWVAGNPYGFLYDRESG